MIRNDRGYTLLLTLGVVLLFTVLGMSLLVLTNNGSAQNVSRQNAVQSLNLAEKSEDNFVQDFNTSIQEILDKNSGLDRNEFVTLLNKVTDLSGTAPGSKYLEGSSVSEYKCQKDASDNIIGGLNVTVAGNGDKSFSCIKEVQDVYNSDGTINDLKKKLIIYNYGESNGKPSSYETTIEVGSNYVPEQLYYALTSKDGSDVHLNGAVEIAGDLRIGGALTLTNHAYFNNNYWAQSKYPLIRSTDYTKRPRIVMKNTDRLYYVNHINGDKNTTLYNNLSPKFDKNGNQTNNNIKPITNIKDYLDLPGSLSEPNVMPAVTDEETIGVEEKIKPYRDANYTVKTLSYYSKIAANEIGNGNYTINKCSRNCPYDATPTLQDATYSINNLKVTTDLNLKNGAKLNINNSLYVKGNLTITGNVEINGNIYVDGNVSIIAANNVKANLKANSIIYTKGTVTVKDSILSSLQVNNNGKITNGTLLVFAEGSISISNISQYQRTPSKIYGYFYSNQQLEIYGVGSFVEIHGGVYGNKIKLNAVRGYTETSKSKSESNQFNAIDGLYIRKPDFLVPNCSNNEFNPSTSCYPPESQSRLKIYYDRNVIETFKELDDTTQIITKIDPPSIINKKFQ